MRLFERLRQSRTPDIELFPDIDSVFESELEHCRRVFFPVCSIRLGCIRKEWGDERIHVVHYNEDPYNVSCAMWFNEYCSDNMIGFDLRNGKYTFKTDFGYFDLSDDWKEWFDLTTQEYQQSRDSYRTSGQTFGIDQLRLGGKPDWLQADATPLDPGGKPMSFITEFDTGNICNDFCDKTIFLFYSHEHQLAVQVYQIT